MREIYSMHITNQCTDNISNISLNISEKNILQVIIIKKDTVRIVGFRVFYSTACLHFPELYNLSDPPKDECVTLFQINPNQLVARQKVRRGAVQWWYNSWCSFAYRDNELREQPVYGHPFNCVSIITNTPNMKIQSPPIHQTSALLVSMKKGI